MVNLYKGHYEKKADLKIAYIFLYKWSASTHLLQWGIWSLYHSLSGCRRKQSIIKKGGKKDSCCLSCTCKSLWTLCEKAVYKYYWAFVSLSTKATSLGLRAWGEQKLKVVLGAKNWGWTQGLEVRMEKAWVWGYMGVLGRMKRWELKKTFLLIIFALSSESTKPFFKKMTNYALYIRITKNYIQQFCQEINKVFLSLISVSSL